MKISPVVTFPSLPFCPTLYKLCRHDVQRRLCPTWRTWLSKILLKDLLEIRTLLTGKIVFNVSYYYNVMTTLENPQVTYWWGEKVILIFNAASFGQMKDIFWERTLSSLQKRSLLLLPSSSSSSSLDVCRLMTASKVQSIFSLVRMGTLLKVVHTEFAFSGTCLHISHFHQSWILCSFLFITA